MHFDAALEEHERYGPRISLLNAGWTAVLNFAELQVGSNGEFIFYFVPLSGIHFPIFRTKMVQRTKIGFAKEKGAFIK